MSSRPAVGQGKRRAHFASSASLEYKDQYDPFWRSVVKIPRRISSMSSPDFFYRAFVSYSHADVAVATAATRALKRIAVPWYRTSRNIFRDDDELAPGEPLPVLLKRELGRSAFLVVVASPHAAASYWVNLEVQWWLAEAGRDPSTVIFIL